VFKEDQKIIISGKLKEELEYINPVENNGEKGQLEICYNRLKLDDPSDKVVYENQSTKNKKYTCSNLGIIED